jgi:hypothetical protein
VWHLKYPINWCLLFINIILAGRRRQYKPCDIQGAPFLCFWSENVEGASCFGGRPRVFFWRWIFCHKIDICKFSNLNFSQLQDIINNHTNNHHFEASTYILKNWVSFTLYSLIIREYDIESHFNNPCHKIKMCFSHVGESKFESQLKKVLIFNV